MKSAFLIFALFIILIIKFFNYKEAEKKEMNKNLFTKVKIYNDTLIVIEYCAATGKLTLSNGWEIDKEMFNIKKIK